jgi:hypothetical protein
MRDDRSAHWQVENEYGPMESVMGSGAKSYVDWAAKMAVATNAGVPWIMCKQDDAPDPVVIFNCHFPRLFFFLLLISHCNCVKEKLEFLQKCN